MTIGIDIDDTLVSTCEFFMPFVAEFLDKPVEYLEENDISYENTPADWGMDLGAFAKKYFDSRVPDTPPKEGAANAVERLRRAGNKVLIITGRTNRYYTDCYRTSRIELENCGIAYDRLICNPDKASVCREEGVDVLIDDLVANCEAVSAVGTKAILFTSMENRNQETSFTRVSDWNEALGALEKLGVPVSK